jgi:hypothetical protein
MNTPGQKRTKVIFILGWGHSGSTLLNLFIGTADKVVTVGEMIFSGFYFRQEHHPKVLRPFFCTCGKSISDCQFWKQALEKSGKARPDIIFDRGVGDRLLWLGRLGVSRVFGRRWGAGDDAPILKAVCPDDGYVCDSSKDFARFCRLLLMDEIEVYPIWLVRDARAVACSYASPKRVELGLPGMSFATALLNWVLINGFCRIALALSGRPWLRISYGHFCQNPAHYAGLLNARLNIQIPNDGVVEIINRKVYHDLGGNLLRFKKIESIQPQEGWRDKMTPARRFITFCLGAQLLNWLWVDRASASGKSSDNC